MSQSKAHHADSPILPMFLSAVLCLGATVHGNPSLLRPVLSLAHTLQHLL